MSKCKACGSIHCQDYQNQTRILQNERDKLLKALKFYADAKKYRDWFIRGDNKGDLARYVIRNL